MALFADPRFVRLFELRREADPPVLLMEYVEGFELGRVGRSLEYGQRARVMAESKTGTAQDPIASSVAPLRGEQWNSTSTYESVSGGV